MMRAAGPLLTRSCCAVMGGSRKGGCGEKSVYYNVRNRPRCMSWKHNGSCSPYVSPLSIKPKQSSVTISAARGRSSQLGAGVITPGYYTDHRGAGPSTYPQCSLCWDASTEKHWAGVSNTILTPSPHSSILAQSFRAHGQLEAEFHPHQLAKASTCQLIAAVTHGNTIESTLQAEVSTRICFPAGRPGDVLQPRLPIHTARECPILDACLLQGRTQDAAWTLTFYHVILGNHGRLFVGKALRYQAAVMVVSLSIRKGGFRIHSFGRP